MTDILKRAFIFLLFATAYITMTAQTGNIKALVSECQRLYNDGDYVAALTVLEKIDTRNLDAGTRQEAELIRALATFETNALKGRGLLLKHLDDYPTANKGLLNCYVAESYYYTGNYDLACAWFAKSDIGRMQPEERDRAKLYHALSKQECGADEEGAAILRELAATSKTHGGDATFHLAVTDYDKDRLKEAYSGFKKIELSDKFYLEVPYYIAGIYLKQGDTGRAKDIATRFIADHDGKMQGIRMHQILGAAEFALGNYAGAVEPLTTYIHGTEEPQRIAYYQLGMSLFKTGSDAARAMEMFGRCCHTDDGKQQKDDAITQNSLLHMGIMRLRNNDMDGAAKDFAAAAAMRHDNSVREEALYNYALCMHKTRDITAGSISIFEQFLNGFPASGHAPQAAEYLADVYLNTDRHDLALQSIERITVPPTTILAAKQKVLYRLGLQEYGNGNMKKCVEHLDRSLATGQHDKETRSAAEYLKGEALYEMSNYKAAAGSYRNSLSAGGENSTMAMYGLAYSLFQLKSYDDARTHFERFVKSDSGDKELIADAHNRIADCYFYRRRYADADKHYRIAGRSGKDGADYALYRSALTMGLSKEYNGKVETLQQMLAAHPGSQYAEQAYHEMARAYIELEMYSEAVATYDELIRKFPQGGLARRAAVEKAMIYNTTGDSERAATAYRDIIAKYPGSEEAQVAMQDLKGIYVETGRVDELAGIADGITESEMDSLTYMVAEKAYSRGDKEDARKKMLAYLSKHPTGAHYIDCHYYLGMLLKEEGNGQDALSHLEKLYAGVENRYTGEAMSLAADIHFTGGNYSEAKELYRRIEATTTDGGRVLLARTRIMEAAYKLNEYNVVKEYATGIIADETAGKELKQTALHRRAKANIATGNDSSAIEDLAAIADDTGTAEGAEAKYLLAQLLFDRKQYKDCEKVVLEFIEASTPHGYWLARSFILLSDTYLKQGKQMEAKQYLLSLQSNYTGNDDIAGMIEERLADMK
ncbi:MAG: tetratricopeptide repeat protein [Bacteroidaceae bacterium]|nr:tetratricopeptide repeat protein [Bacteroidaceae bacterium]